MTINEDNFKDLNIGEQFNTFTIYSNNEADELKEDTSISSFGQLDIDNNLRITGFYKCKNCFSLSRLSYIMFDNMIFEGDIKTYYINSSNLLFEECSIDSGLNLKDCENITFDNMYLELNDIHNCSDVLFKNCTIDISSYFNDNTFQLNKSYNIKFINCNVKCGNNKFKISDSEKISLKNCTLEDAITCIESVNSSINLLHSKFKDSKNVFSFKNSKLYARLLKFSDNNRLIKNFDNVETQIISVPKLIISEI